MKNKTPSTDQSTEGPQNDPGKDSRQSNYTARERRALEAMRAGPVMREQLDRICGASNSPHVVMCLRRKGYRIRTERVKRTDRDGFSCLPGQYRLLAEPGVIK